MNRMKQKTAMESKEVKKPKETEKNITKQTPIPVEETFPLQNLSEEEMKEKLEKLKINPSLVNEMDLEVQLRFIKKDYHNIVHFKDETLEKNPILKQFARETRDYQIRHPEECTKEKTSKPIPKEHELER